MDSERWQQIEEIFQSAFELEAPARDAYLTQVCGDDRELRREVESLLAHQVFDTFIHEPIHGAAQALADVSDHELIGARLGPYRVTQLIGTGGMGAVYAAVRDDEQFHQQVAVKIVRRGMGSQFILNRFRAERRILAGLEHPNIARLLDGGTTADGSPYFVMEFIEGQPINEYCATQQLSLADRLKLFCQVCGAVQYAHQKLVVHRDLKPGNILVNQDGVPKLLDFGIAKLLDPVQAEADPARTATLMRMLTPDYASPEQVRGAGVTTATDVYSLGAVLYELLTGQRPHRLQQYTPSEIERVVCAVEVERPSEAASRADANATKLRRQLAGDLDNIILMALRKEPERRYQAVQQFSEDLHRHLDGRPVLARSDTIRYRTGKFVQRHKLGVAASVLVLLSLVGGLLVANYQARRAERRFQQVRKLANTFLFDFHDKIQSLPGSTEARELVVKTALEYLDSLAGEAQGDTSLQLELAGAYDKVGQVQGYPGQANLGHPAEALASFRKGLAVAEQVVRREPQNTQGLRVLSNGYYKIGYMQIQMGDAPPAKANLQQCLQLAEQVRALEPGNAQTNRMLGIAYGLLGESELKTGDLATALRQHQAGLQANQLWDAAQHDHRTQYAVSYSQIRLGNVLHLMGDLAGAQAHYQQAVALREAIVQQQSKNQFYRRALIPSYHTMAELLGNPIYLNLAQPEAALTYYQKALTVGAELLAADPKNAQAKQDHSLTYQGMGFTLLAVNPKQAAELLRKALALSDALREMAPENTAYQSVHGFNLTGLAQCLTKLDSHAEALRIFRQALEIHQVIANKEQSEAVFQQGLILTHNGWGDLLQKTGDLATAQLHYQQALKVAESLAGANPVNLEPQRDRAECYTRLGHWHATAATVRNLTAAQRLAEWQLARDWQQKALAIWGSWSQHGKSSLFDTTRHEQSVRAVAECESAIASLTSANR